MNIIYKINSDNRCCNPKLSIEKTVDKEMISLCDTLTFTIKLLNDGDVYLDYILLKDNISDSLDIIESEFKIYENILDEVDLKKGLYLGALNINESIIITYKIKVKLKEVISSILLNTQVDYGYRLSNGYLGSIFKSNCICELKASLDSFKQISLEDKIVISDDKKDLNSILQIKTDVIIKKYYTVKTPVAKSLEYQNLSGHKVAVYGEIDQIIQYTSDENDSKIYYFKNKTFFNNFIVLPSSYKPNLPIKIEAISEHVHCNILNKRTLLQNIDILLIAKSLR